ncbi:MAG: Na+/H+ antiporter NhaA [Gammaproteobacteria bacterium]|nr:Na+/H+ antiporter NhaA [Gammaproteobacteria bacterium]
MDLIQAEKIKALSIKSGQWMLFSCLIAIFIANSPWQSVYADFNNTKLAFHVGSFTISKPLLIWMNEGLMAIFFFLIGLEIREAFESGTLSDWKTVSLPIYGAIGGMVVPGLIYYLFNYPYPDYISGWAIPVATDIAFSLAILAMVTPGVQPKLRLFLSTLAIVDDIGAIIVIALFYSDHLSLVWFLTACGWLGLALILRAFKVSRFFPYFIISVFMWYAIIYSGLHATLTGVILAMLLPQKNQNGQSMVNTLLHELEPWVNFIILPLFAFMNCGIILHGFNADTLMHPILSGTFFGLWLGKPLGVMTFVLLAVGLKLSVKDKEIQWGQLMGVACLTGIGFTMSLFIASLSFEYHASLLPNAKLGIILGSVFSALMGSYFLMKSK